MIFNGEKQMSKMLYLINDSTEHPLQLDNINVLAETLLHARKCANGFQASLENVMASSALLPALPEPNLGASFHLRRLLEYQHQQRVQFPILGLQIDPTS